ncbi:MAG: hypothetical protein ACYC1M_17715 [Armatimonadota bacterium]
MKQTSRTWKWLVILTGCIVAVVMIGNNSLHKPEVYNCNEYRFPEGDKLILDQGLYFYAPQKMVFNGHTGKMLSGNVPFKLQGIQVTPKYLILKLKAGDGFMFIQRQYGYRYHAKDMKASQVIMEKYKIKSPVEFTPVVCN